MDKLACFGLFVALVCYCDAIRWKDCGSVHGKVSSVMVTGCETTPVCSLAHNTNVSFTVVFTPDEIVTKAKTVVHGVIGGIPVPFPVDDPDACDGSAKITCPLKANVQYTYSTNMFVKSIYPKVKVVVEWEMTDQNGKDVFCIELPAEIVDSKKKHQLLFNSLLP